MQNERASMGSEQSGVSSGCTSAEALLLLCTLQFWKDCEIVADGVLGSSLEGQQAHICKHHACTDSAQCCCIGMCIIQAAIFALLKPTSSNCRNSAALSLPDHSEQETRWTASQHDFACRLPYMLLTNCAFIALQASIAAGDSGIPKVRLLLANLVAGAVGGSAAAALTQPLDVVKTRAQLGHQGRSTSVLQVPCALIAMPLIETTGSDASLRGWLPM